MKIGLIAVDTHNFPNLPLMKISAYHKARGDNVDWHFKMYHYDIVYISKVFTSDKDIDYPIYAEQIIKGGTGYGLQNKLPDEIEHMCPDYTIYPQYNESYGFLTRGCPRACLHGDTIIRTTNGSFPIRELIGKENIKVLSRKEDGRIGFVPAINICKTGENRKLIRVSFDDGTHIDCTPDHKFKRFLNGNQYEPVREFDTRADELKPCDSVVAVKVYKTRDGYEEISWGRRKRIRYHRLVVESDIGRILKHDEYVHHKNGNPLDNRICNLEITDPTKHIKLHPEISERMKINNPVHKMDETAKERWKKNISNSGKGVKRTMEQRIKYRNSKLGAKNPNYIDGKHTGQPSRINHKVVSIVELDGLHDTYCMEIPDIHWFFANDVFVHNCDFCIVSEKEGRKSHQVADLNDFHRGQKVIKLLDPNLLACKDREKLIQQLADSKSYIDFTQGLDIRLADKDIIEQLNKLKIKMLHFAWDNPREDLADKFIEFDRYTNVKDERKRRVYVLTNFDSTHDEDLHRIYTLQRLGYDPFVMIYEKDTAPLQTRQLQRWCNNKPIYRKVPDFREYDTRLG